MLGRPKGSKNKERVLDPFKSEILDYLRKGLNVASVMKLINPQLAQPVTYNTYRYYVRTENELRRAWRAKRCTQSKCNCARMEPAGRSMHEVYPVLTQADSPPAIFINGKPSSEDHILDLAPSCDLYTDPEKLINALNLQLEE